MMQRSFVIWRRKGKEDRVYIMTNRIIILTTSIMLLSQSQVALAAPRFEDIYSGGSPCFWLVAIPSVIYAVYKEYGISASIISAIGIGIIVYNYPQVLLYIDGIVAFAFLVGMFTGWLK